MIKKGPLWGLFCASCRALSALLSERHVIDAGLSRRVHDVDHHIGG